MSDPRAGIDPGDLDRLRREIGVVDEELVRLLARRVTLAREIGATKQRLGLPVMDPSREAEVVRRAAARARAAGLDAEVMRDILWRLIDHAREVQDHPPSDPT